MLSLLRRRRQASLDEEGSWPGGGGGTLGAGGGMSPPGTPSGTRRLPTLSELNAAKAEGVARFKQQTLKSYTVTFSPRLVLGIYFAVALAFIPLGAAILAGSVDIRDTERVVYTDLCTLGRGCVVRVNVTRRIPPPSYLYYVVTNLHQNHLDYVTSLSHKQLRGEVPGACLDVNLCYPQLYKDDRLNANVQEDKICERPFNVSELRNPCGLQAASFFNDTFKLCRSETSCGGNLRIRTTEDGIAWSTDRAHVYSPNADNFAAATNRLLQDEHFMVWMRLSTFERVEKLFAIVEEPLEIGLYYMHIDSLWDARAFNGNKTFYISNTKWFGAKNSFLGLMYIVTGLLSLAVAIVVLAFHVLSPRKSVQHDPDIIRRELAAICREHAQANSPLS